VLALREGEFKALRACESESEFSLLVLRIKLDRSGVLPPDWEEEVLASGMMDGLVRRWEFVARHGRGAVGGPVVRTCFHRKRRVVTEWYEPLGIDDSDLVEEAA
jgi:hypothetical protein